MNSQSQANNDKKPKAVIIDIGGKLTALWNKETAVNVISHHVREGRQVNVFHHDPCVTKKISDAVRKYGIMDNEKSLFYERINRKHLVGRQYLWDIITYKVDNGNLTKVGTGTVIETSEHRRSKSWQVVYIGGKKFRTRELHVAMFKL